MELRRLLAPISLLIALPLAVTGCGGADPEAAPTGRSVQGDGGPADDGATARTSGVPSAQVQASAAEPTGAGPAGASGAATTPPPGVAPTDAAAGVTARQVPQVGDGNLVTVPGAASPHRPEGRIKEVAVQIEGGLPADPQPAAEFVLATLNDPRGWTVDGYSFARTDDVARADIVVVLASPQTSADLCRPLITGGKLSCREGRRAILTWYRWVEGHPDYEGDLTGYRQYVVNHEVGHALGRGHVSCPGAGAPAPVMMQQTKGLKPCAPNPWPHPQG